MLKHLKKTETEVFCTQPVNVALAVRHYYVTAFPTEVTCIRCLAFAVEHHERRAWTAEAKFQDLVRVTTALADAAEIACHTPPNEHIVRAHLLRFTLEGFKP